MNASRRVVGKAGRFIEGKRGELLMFGDSFELMVQRSWGGFSGEFEGLQNWRNRGFGWCGERDD